MKTAKLLLGLVVTLLAAGFLSCTKTNTVTKIDSVFLTRQTLVLRATKDASIFLQDPVTNTSLTANGDGAGDVLRVGYNDNNAYFSRTLVAFDVSSLPANAVIDNVTLSFNIARVGTQISNNPVSVYKLTQDWTEGTSDEATAGGCCCTYGYAYCNNSPGVGASGGKKDVTWDSVSHVGPAWTTPGGTFASTASATITNPGVFVASSQGLIDDVKAWRTTASSNFGWILKVNEANVQKNGGEQIRLFSREASTSKAARAINGSSTVSGADPSSKPTLTILYH